MERLERSLLLGRESQLWAGFGDGREDCGALGTVRHAVRGIFYIASHKHLALRGQDGCSHFEVGKRCVRVVHHFAGGAQEALAHAAEILVVGILKSIFLNRRCGPL